MKIKFRKPDNIDKIVIEIDNCDIKITQTIFGERYAGEPIDESKDFNLSEDMSIEHFNIELIKDKKFLDRWVSRMSYNTRGYYP